MNMKKRILDTLKCVESDINKKIDAFDKVVCVDRYSSLVRHENGIEIWTDAIQKALSEGQVVKIPFSEKPYYTDKTLIIPSGTKIVADINAVIKRAPGFNFVMLRNQHNSNGKKRREPETNRDADISVEGGIWDGACDEFCHTPYDENMSFFGVNATLFFNHLDNLSVKNVTIENSGEFAIQVGDLCCAIFENVKFVNCHADGIHINGNTTKVVARNIKGEVGDDLVALNAFDWERSSVNFGRISNILCEGLELSEDSRYKAIRILPGKYTYDDGTISDCEIENVIIKNVRGINTFKAYFQRERYFIGENQAYGAPGRINNMFFEDIVAEIKEPIDKFSDYVTNNPVNGHFAAFEMGSDIGYLSFENVSISIDKEKNPKSYFLTIGAKSIRVDEWEIFDPQIGGTINRLDLKNVNINGKAFSNTDYKKYICEIVFDDIYNDGKSSSVGKIKELDIR